MTSWIPIVIGRKKIIAKAGGYTGKTEAKTPKGDVITANRIWLSEAQKKALGLKYGQVVKMRIGGTTKVGKVLRWSRGSAQIVFTRAGLPRRTPVYTTAKAPKYASARAVSNIRKKIKRLRRR
jgi:hypothetical protein